MLSVQSHCSQDCDCYEPFAPASTFANPTVGLADAEYILEPDLTEYKSVESELRALVNVLIHEHDWPTDYLGCWL